MVRFIFALFLCVGSLNVQADYTPELWKEISDLVTEITHRFPPDQYYYVGVGRSPTPIIALLQELGLDALNLPLTQLNSHAANVDRRFPAGFEPLKPREQERLFEHFERFLPTPQQLKGRRILLIDYTINGFGLRNARSYLRLFAEKMRDDLRFKLLPLKGYSEAESYTADPGLILDIPPEDFIPLRSKYPHLQSAMYHHLFGAVAEYRAFDIRGSEEATKSKGYDDFRHFLRSELRLNTECAKLFK